MEFFFSFASAHQHMHTGNIAGFKQVYGQVWLKWEFSEFFRLKEIHEIL